MDVLKHGICGICDDFASAKMCLWAVRRIRGVVALTEALNARLETLWTKTAMKTIVVCAARLLTLVLTGTYPAQKQRGAALSMHS
jgi:hypothetical protein